MLAAHKKLMTVYVAGVIVILEHVYPSLNVDVTS